MKFCKALKDDHSPCNAAAGSGSEFCFHHDPDRKVDSAIARQKGVEAARKKLKKQKNTPDGPLKTFKLNNLSDVKRMLAAVINDFRLGLITAEDARVTAYVSNILISAIKDGDMEMQLKRLEDMIKERRIEHVRKY